jgi:hypothetical protein
MAYTIDPNTTLAENREKAPSLVRWNGVFSGSIIGLAVFALFDALWLALGYESHVATFYQSLDWWIAGTAIATMAIAGFIAGGTSATRGVLSGWMNAMTTWGLVLLAVLLFALPVVGYKSNTGHLFVSGHDYVVTFVSYWTAFWAILIGYGAATLGGIAGGLLRRADPEPTVAQRDLGSTTPTDTRTSAGAGAGHNGYVRR